MALLEHVSQISSTPVPGTQHVISKCYSLGGLVEPFFCVTISRLKPLSLGCGAWPLNSTAPPKAM
jgi:hypothetical protein